MAGTFHTEPVNLLILLPWRRSACHQLFNHLIPQKWFMRASHTILFVLGARLLYEGLKFFDQRRSASFSRSRSLISCISLSVQNLRGAIKMFAVHDIAVSVTVSSFLNRSDRRNR